MRDKDVMSIIVTCTAILAGTFYIGGTVIQQAIFRSACEGVSKKELPKVFTTMIASGAAPWPPTEWDDKTYSSYYSSYYYSSSYYSSSYYSFAASAENNTQPSVWNATYSANQDDINPYLGGTVKTHHAVCKKSDDGQEPISKTPSAFYTPDELAGRGVVDYMEDEPPKDVLIDYPEEEPRCTDASLAPIYFFSGGTTSNYEQCNKKLSLLQLMFPGTSAQMKILEGNKSRYWDKTWMGGVLGVVLPVLVAYVWNKRGQSSYDEQAQSNLYQNLIVRSPASEPPDEEAGETKVDAPGMSPS